jgi:hypothetical protein
LLSVPGCNVQASSAVPFGSVSDPIRLLFRRPGHVTFRRVSEPVDDDAPEEVGWDDLNGKQILVGLRIEDPRGKRLRMEQLYGRIVTSDPKRGICLELHTEGRTYWLPPDLRSVRRAPAGEYRLRSTGEVVENPDLLASWVLVQPDA